MQNKRAGAGQRKARAALKKARRNSPLPQKPGEASTVAQAKAAEADGSTPRVIYRGPKDLPKIYEKTLEQKAVVGEGEPDYFYCSWEQYHLLMSFMMEFQGKQTLVYIDALRDMAEVPAATANKLRKEAEAR